jgi:hypothetical protein
MSIRMLGLAVAFVSVCAAPAPAPPPVAKGAPGGDRPVVTFQVSSVKHVLEDVRAGIKFTAGPMGDKVLDEFNTEFEKTFGKEGLDGIDATKPAGGYLTFGDTPEEIQVVLLFPATDEKKTVALVNRTMFKAAPVPGNPGLYKLTIPDEPAMPFPIRLRLHDGYAYVGFNVPDTGMAPTALVTAAKVIDPLEKATLVVRGLPGKVPSGFFKNIKAQMAEEWNRDKEQFAKQGDRGNVEFIKGVEALVFKGLHHLEANTDAVTWRLNFDRATATFTDEETFEPKAGTGFATEITNWGMTTNRFAGLADDKAAAWAVTKLPVFNAEIKQMLSDLLDVAAVDFPPQTPEPAQALVKEFAALGKRTALKGEGDLGVALYGPGKDGLFTIVIAVAAEDPSGFDKELRAAAKHLPLKGPVAMDVAKVGDVMVHEAKLGGVLPPELQKAFRKEGVTCIGVSKTALYVGFGPEARAKVSAAAGLKPGPAAAFDTRFNPMKIAAFAKACDETVGGFFAKGLGTDDKMVPFWTVTVTGGTALTIKQTSNVLSAQRVLFFMLEGLFR